MVVFGKPEELIHWLGQLLKKEKPQSKMSIGFVRVFDGIIEELMMGYGHSVCWDDEWLPELLDTIADDPKPICCSTKILGFVSEVYSTDLRMGKLDLEEAIRLLLDSVGIGDDELRIVKKGGERYVLSTRKFEAENKLKVRFSLEQALSQREQENAKFAASLS